MYMYMCIYVYMLTYTQINNKRMSMCVCIGVYWSLYIHVYTETSFSLCCSRRMLAKLRFSQPLCAAAVHNLSLQAETSESQILSSAHVVRMMLITIVVRSTPVFTIPVAPGVILTHTLMISCYCEYSCCCCYDPWLL